MNEHGSFELLLKQAKPIANEAEAEAEEGETEIAEYAVLELLECLKDALPLQVNNARMGEHLVAVIGYKHVVF